jgi:tetratricopeptide (TPR) repeat protein
LLFCNQERYAEALPLAERALAIREQALDASHPNIAESLNTLAQLYEGQGQYEKAPLFLQRSLTILKKALPDHPTTTTTQERIVALLFRMGQAEEALAVQSAAKHPGAVSRGGHTPV